MRWASKYYVVDVFRRMRLIVLYCIAVMTVALMSLSKESPSNSQRKDLQGSMDSSGHVMWGFGADTVYFVPYRSKSIRVEIQVSKAVGANVPRKMLLLLPGWNYADTQWCTRTSVCSTALSRGFDVMLVEMGKSVYMDSLYPEMRVDYREHPTREWLWKEVLQPLQVRGYFTDKGVPEDPIITTQGRVYYKSMKLPFPTFVMGLSTGARGALLLAIEHPEAFRGCAGLSGDYDPLSMKSDNLMINCLGKYEQVPWRWRGSNNIQLRINELSVPCYLAHGEADNVVPFQQSQQLFDAHENARRAAGNSIKRSPMKSVLVKNGSHNYTFWGEQGIQALDFFEELFKNASISK